MRQGARLSVAPGDWDPEGELLRERILQLHKIMQNLGSEMDTSASQGTRAGAPDPQRQTTTGVNDGSATSTARCPAASSGYQVAHTTTTPTPAPSVSQGGHSARKLQRQVRVGPLCHLANHLSLDASVLAVRNTALMRSRALMRSHKIAPRQNPRRNLP